MATTAEQFMKHLLDLLKSEEECTTEHYLPDGSVTIQIHCNDTLFETGETDCSIKVTLAESDASEQRNASMQQAYKLSKAGLQEQADIIERMVLSIAGCLNDEKLGEATVALLTIKRELGLTSDLPRMLK